MSDKSTANIDIVLVDDNPVALSVITNFLENLETSLDVNFRIYSVTNGVEGLGLVYAIKPQIIIVDLTLPQYSGKEILDLLLANREFSNVNFLLLHDGTRELPKGIFLINKTQGTWVGDLIRGIKDIVGADHAHFQTRFFGRLQVNLGRKCVIAATRADIANEKAARTRNLFVKALYSVEWLLIQFLLSVYLSAFYIFGSRQNKYLNIAVPVNTEKNLADRVKVYPALAFFLTASFMFLLPIFLALATALSFFAFTANNVFAASYTWDGGGATDNWSDCANWSTDICPVAADTVTFNGTSTKNSIVDGGFAGTITIINISAGYTGTISLQRSLTVNSTFTQSSGTFDSGSQPLTVTSTFTLNSGSNFNASSAITTFSGNFTINGGTFNHNGGTANFNGGAGSLNCNNIVFNNVTISATGTALKSLVSNCTLPLGNDPTITRVQMINNATLSGTGILTIGGGNDSSFDTATVSITGFTGFAVHGLVMSNANLDFSAYTSFTQTSAARSITMNSGTLTLPNGADINGALFISGGTFNAPSGNMSVGTSFSVTNSPTINHNGGTITFDGTGFTTASCNGISFFNNVVVAATGSAIKGFSGCPLVPFGNNPTTTRVSFTNSTASGTGTLTMAGGGDSTFATGSSITGFTGLSAQGLTITGGNLNLSSYTSFVQGPAGNTVNLSSGSLSLPNGADINGNLTISGGTFTAPSGAMTLAANLTISGVPTFNANGGTINFDSTAGGTLNCNNVTFNAVNFTHTSNTKTVSSTCNLPLGNNPTIGTGSGSTGLINNGTLTGTGTLNNGVLNLNAGSSLVGFTGINSNSTFTISGATADFSAYASFVATSVSPVSVSSGSLSLPNGADLNSSYSMTGGTLTAPSGTMSVAGNFSMTGPSIFNSSGGIISFDGGSATLSCNNATFNQIIFAHTTGTKTIASNCTFPLGNNATIAAGGSILSSGTLTGTGILTALGGGTLSFGVGSNFTNFTGIVTGKTFTNNGSNINMSAYTQTEFNAPFTMSSGSLTGSTVGTTEFNSTYSQTGGTFNQGTGGATVFESTAVISVAAVFNSGAATTDFNSHLTFSGGTFNASSGTTYVSGYMTFTGGNFVHNNGAFVFDGAIATIDCNNAVFNSVDIDAGDNLKVIIAGCNFPVGNNPTISRILLRGSLSGSGALNLTSANSNSFDPGSAITGFTGINSTGDLLVSETLNLASYTTVNLDQSLEVNAGIFTAPSGIMTVAGDFAINAGEFNHNNGTVVLDGGDQEVWGTKFYKLSKITSSANTLTFSALVPQIVENDLTLKGAAGNLLSLRSSSPGTQWRIDPRGGREFEYLDVQDSNNINSAVIQVTDGTNTSSGNNTNWNFFISSASNLGPESLINGSASTETQPEFEFNISDGDTNDTVKYKIQVDNNSDFSAPEIDYTSPLLAQGNQTFTTKPDDQNNTALDTQIPRDDWFDQNWQYRKQLNFFNKTSSTALINVPVLVKLTKDNTDYSLIKPDGGDLRFTDSDGETLLNYEIEEFNPAGNSFIWVRVPQIDQLSDSDHIFMYYGNAAVATTQNKTAVWGSEHLGVWHLNQDLSVTTAFLDSSPINNTMTANSFRTIDSVRCIIGKCLDFDDNQDGGGHSNMIGEASKLDTYKLAAGQNFTVSAWTKNAQDTSHWQYIFATEQYSNPPRTGFQLTVNPNERAQFGAYNGCCPSTSSPFSLSLGEWHHILGIREGDKQYIYVDGVYANEADIPSQILDRIHYLKIGAGDLNYFAAMGLIDEVRITTEVLSPGRIAADYKMGKDRFVSFSSQQTPLLTVVDPAANSGGYTVGSEGMKLADGLYYWRVSTSDMTGASSEYTVASEPFTTTAAEVAFKVDTTGPIGSVVISDDTSSSDPTKLILDIQATDAISQVTDMRIAGNANFTNSNWVAYNTEQAYTAPDPAGINSVFIRFRDSLGNESLIYSDSINFTPSDADAVTVDLVSPINGEQVASSKPVLKWETEIPDEQGNCTRIYLLRVGGQERVVSGSEKDQLDDDANLLVTLDNPYINSYRLEKELQLGKYIWMVKLCGSNGEVLAESEVGEFIVIEEQTVVDTGGSVEPPQSPPSGEDGDIDYEVMLGDLFKNGGVGFPLLIALSVAILVALLLGPLQNILGRIGALLGFVTPRKRKYWGIVYDIEGSKPIPFAEVILRAVQAGQIQERVITDLQGRYAIPIEASARYIVEGSAPDYVPVTREINYKAGEDVVLDLGLARRNGGNIAKVLQLLHYRRQGIFSLVRQLVFVLMVVGLAVTVYALTLSPTTFNFVILGVYVLIILLNILTWYAGRSSAGKVIEAQSSNPVPTAIVRAYDQLGKVEDVALTNINGKVKLNVKTGNKEIYVQKVGYSDQREGVYIDKGGNINKTITLTQANSTPSENKFGM